MIDKNRLIADLALVREKSPLVHNITNYVVMNNTANALLSIGASPVMAHALEEVRDMVSIASALVLNMGTLSPEWVEAMIMAGEAAIARGIPVIFDPVGAGATPYRNETAARILGKCRPSIIRGNASEILSLARESAATKGVDSTADSSSALDAAKRLDVSAIEKKTYLGMAKLFAFYILVLVTLQFTFIYLLIIICPGLPSEIKSMLLMTYYFLPLLGIAVAINTIKLRGAIPVFCGIFLVVAVALEFFHVI